MKVDLISFQKILGSKDLYPSALTRFGISSATISKILKGEDVRPGTVLKIADVLNVPMESLVKEDPFYEILKDHLEKAVLIG